MKSPKYNRSFARSMWRKSFGDRFNLRPRLKLTPHGCLIEKREKTTVGILFRQFNARCA